MNIFEAVEKGDLAQVRKLIAEGVNVNEANNQLYKETPLHLATKKVEKKKYFQN